MKQINKPKAVRPLRANTDETTAKHSVKNCYIFASANTDAEAETETYNPKKAD